MRFRYRTHILTAVCLSLSMLFGGCTYMKNRGDDAVEIMDLGFTINNNWKPQAALYIDFLSLLTIGYSSFDGQLVGNVDKRIGIGSLEQKSWGVVLWGSEKKGSGEFNPRDPYEARPDQIEETERPSFNSGILRRLVDRPDAPALHYAECDKILHLGWIGIYECWRHTEFFDFLLGWTTLDIMGDDDAGEK